MADFPESLGPYKIDSEIGSGSCGRVLKAYDNRLSRWVAIKLLYAYQEQNIEQEARLLASINHPNIVSVYDIIENNEKHWTALVMEYLPGKTLQDVLNSGQVIRLEKALSYCMEIAKGLSAAHKLGIIHRDLKPENIFLDSQEHLKIGDFGIANLLGDKDPNAMLGSLNSLSPEQVLGKELSLQSDLFSLGLLLYQMLTGHHPFAQGDGSEEMLKRLVNDAYPPVSGHSEAVLSLVSGLLAKTPSQRYQSAHEVVDKVQQILDVEFSHFTMPTLKQNNPIVAKYRSANKRNYWPWVKAIVIAVILTAVMLQKDYSSAKNHYIVVLKPVIKSGELLEDIALVQTAVFQAAAEAISSLPSYFYVSPDEITDLTGTTDSISNILNITAANEVIYTLLNCIPLECAVTFSHWQGKPAALVSQHIIHVPIDKPLFVADYVQNYLTALLGDGANSKQIGRPISELAYRQFLLLEHKHQLGIMSLSELITGLEALNQWSCDFEALCQLLLRSYLRKYFFELDVDWLQRAKKLIAQADLGKSKLFLLTAAVVVAIIEKDYAKADLLLSQLERDHLNNDAVVSLRARWYFEQGFNVKGKSLMAELVAQRPSAQHQYNYALMLFRLDEFEQSMLVLKQLLVQVPDYSKALELKAALLFSDGLWQEVIVAYQQLIRKDHGENPHTLNNVGLAHLMVKDTTTAMTYFHRAVEIAPNNPSFLLNLADAQVLSGKETLADSNYRNVINLLSQLNNKSIDDNMALALAYARLKQKDQALEALLKVLKTNSDNKFVLYNIGLIYLLVDDTSACIDYLEQAVDAGLAKTWLQLPWFNILSEHHKFLELL